MACLRVLLFLSCCLAELSIARGACREDNGFRILKPEKSFLYYRPASEAERLMNDGKVNLDMAQKYCQALGGKLPEPKTTKHLTDVTDKIASNKIFFFGYKRNSDGEHVSLTGREKLPDTGVPIPGKGDCIIHNKVYHDGSDQIQKSDCDDKDVNTVVCEMECNENSATLGRKFRVTIKAETQGAEPCTEQSRIVCEVELEPKTNSKVKVSVPEESKSYILKGDPSETQYRKVLYQEHGYFKYECQATLHILGIEIKTTSTTAFIQFVLAATSVAITIICVLVVVPILVIVFVMFRRKKAEDDSVDLEAPSRRASDRSRYSSRVGSTRSVLPTTTTGTAKSVTCKTKAKSFTSTFSATKFKSNPSSFSTTKS